MTDTRTSSTRVGRVASVNGGLVRVRLQGLPTTLLMVAGESYRVGQIGAFMRIPLGYTQLYGVCTQVGAEAAPSPLVEESTRVPALDEPTDSDGYRWLSIALFGESVGGHFDRGVGQYPTVGDEVHLVTPHDLKTIYSGRSIEDAITVGRIAGSPALPARLQLSTLVSRHCCIVGSTGAGKSNLVAVVLESLTDGAFPSSRTLVIDPHGEYAGAAGEHAHVVHTGVDTPAGEPRLRIPFWALPFDELIDMTMGDMQPTTREVLRDRIADMKRKAATYLANPPAPETVTADSPVPFSIRRLWFELEKNQRITYRKPDPQNEDTACHPIDAGDAASLRPPVYPAVSLGSAAPFQAKRRLGIGRQLDMLHSRLRDNRFGFMFDADDPLHPDLEGRTKEDLAALLEEWVGNDKPVTVLDVSGLPPDVLSAVVGTMLRIIYDAMFWAMNLPVGGRERPLLIVLDEAHRFLPSGADTPAHRVVSRIAKEGRKYGVGLMVVTQRPSDIDQGVLSQCGTMIALRVTNGADRSAVSNTIPDDLGGLVGLLPSLRTGEALVLGDALQVPSRIRVRKARRKRAGTDPLLPETWVRPRVTDKTGWDDAVTNWRAQSTAKTTKEGE